MKNTLFKAIVVLAVMTGAYGIVMAADPHVDYRPNFSSGCSGAACHTLDSGTFIPQKLDTVKPQNDYSNFCLSCHNTTSEAHDKSAGVASTNLYVNQTGIDKSGSYKGTSHSWKGTIGKAGTNTPTLIGPDFRPGGKVMCQTCHSAMYKTYEEDIGFAPSWIPGTDQGDNMNYQLGSGVTKKYLAQYIRVYKTATAMPTAPSNVRTRKTYLVSPGLYTYDPATGMITFSSPQTGFIYADIPQPYLRAGNATNALCLDCHADRNDQFVEHEPGTGVKDNHPVVVNYGSASGLHDTLKVTADGNIYLEGGKVYCTSCHDPHNASSNDGQMLRSANGSDLCTDCHKVNGYDGYSTAFIGVHNGSKHSAATECLACHTTHGSRNIMLIRNKINGKNVSFSVFSGPGSFSDNSGSGLCAACHTATTYHKADGSGQNHNNNKNCTECHKHSTGFNAGGCTGCHGDPPAVTANPVSPEGWSDTTGDAHSTHITYLADAEFGGGILGHAACEQCHGADPGNNAGHNTNKPTAAINTGTWESWASVGGSWGTATFDIGTTIGKVSTADDHCTNVSCHGASGTRIWGGGTDCDSCHSYPTTASEWSAGNGHLVRYDGVTNRHLPATGYDKTTDTYAGMTADPAKCGLCHSGGTHRDGTVDLNPNGHAACGGGNFTINPDKTCSNVDCHSANRTTPNWY